MKGFSIAGIGTDVGKTVVSAILAEALVHIILNPFKQEIWTIPTALRLKDGVQIVYKLLKCSLNY